MATSLTRSWPLYKHAARFALELQTLQSCRTSMRLRGERAWPCYHCADLKRIGGTLLVCLEGQLLACSSGSPCRRAPCRELELLVQHQIHHAGWLTLSNQPSLLQLLCVR